MLRTRRQRLRSGQQADAEDAARGDVRGRNGSVTAEASSTSDAATRMNYLRLCVRFV
jgi:hypothetical protein